MSPSSLEQAPDEIKLAVELIYLLETNEVPLEIALKALNIVTDDVQKKISNTQKLQDK